MIRSLLAAALLLALPAPAAPFGVPLCTSAEYLFAAKEEGGWHVQPFAVAEQGSTAYLSLGPTGQVEVFAVTPDGLACLIFSGGQVAESATEPPEPTLDQRDG